MKLERQLLYIAKEKLLDYLLNTNHVDGGSKAKLLIASGFSEDDTATLEEAILVHCTANESGDPIKTLFGEKYLVEGNLETPGGRALNIRSVWIREKNEELIKFVTLYPL